ncbi:MAG: hypothetical protein IJT30_11685 [Muribaculaceae bacterium]|nr:hypothetical protein [Muribaculaceae bacterium]
MITHETLSMQNRKSTTFFRNSSRQVIKNRVAARQEGVSMTQTGTRLMQPARGMILAIASAARTAKPHHTAAQTQATHARLHIILQSYMKNNS